MYRDILFTQSRYENLQVSGYNNLDVCFRANCPTKQYSKIETVYLHKAVQRFESELSNEAGQLQVTITVRVVKRSACES